MNDHLVNDLRNVSSQWSQQFPNTRDSIESEVTGGVSCLGIELLTMTGPIAGKLGGAEAGCFGSCVQCPRIQ